jgi:hypothetical protein
VRHEVELVVTLADPGRAAERVERDRRVPGLREALRELGVEAVEPADVRDDHDADGVRRGRVGQRRREVRAVLGAEREHLRAGAAGEGREHALGRQGGRP